MNRNRVPNLKRIPVPELKGYIIAYVAESFNNRDLCVYGDPEGLRSLGEAIIAIADLKQAALPDQECPGGESYHRHYVMGQEVDEYTRERLPRLTIGRVDEKVSGVIRDVFPPRSKRRRRQSNPKC